VQVDDVTEGGIYILELESINIFFHSNSFHFNSFYFNDNLRKKPRIFL